MKERPILFSGPMVSALLDGAKTQTRRIVKPPNKWADRFPICNPAGMAAGHEIWWWDGEFDRVGASQSCPYGQPGDRLWVKETWRPRAARDDWDLDVHYAVDGAVRTIKDGEFGDKDWSMPKAAATGNVSPLFMPRWASRLTLEITEVRVERLQDCSEGDAVAEGIHRIGEEYASFADPESHWHDGPNLWTVDIDGWSLNAPTAVEAYRMLWEIINSDGSWEKNPWVWALSFKVVDNG